MTDPTPFIVASDLLAKMDAVRRVLQEIRSANRDEFGYCANSEIERLLDEAEAKINNPA